MSTVYLFYGTQLVAELPAKRLKASHIKSQFGQEIYDGGYLYSPALAKPWWRCDATPSLSEDVPPEIRALALLLT
jgi:hypothetical protein